MSADLITKYDTAFGPVELSPDTVKRYLAKGQNFTDQELSLFINLCMYQKLNPFVNEAYLIKYGAECQMVIGYSAYARRAEDYPDYARREDGITVQRGNEIIQKAGQCLYPGEKLIGGWCVVYKLRNGVETSCGMVEVQLEEYIQKKNDGTPNTNWKNKPATMIHKVAVSQALRAAFPKDFAGLYIPEESHVMIADVEAEPENEDCEITQEQRQMLLNAAKSKFGTKWKEQFKVLCAAEAGLSTTVGMKTSQYEAILKSIVTGDFAEGEVSGDEKENSQNGSPGECTGSNPDAFLEMPQ